jgi:hypothetical protein
VSINDNIRHKLFFVFGILRITALHLVSRFLNLFVADFYIKSAKAPFVSARLSTN